jgi:hypothetical protein
LEWVNKMGNLHCKHSRLYSFFICSNLVVELSVGKGEQNGKFTLQEFKAIHFSFSQTYLVELMTLFKFTSSFCYWDHCLFKWTEWAIYIASIQGYIFIFNLLKLSSGTVSWKKRWEIYIARIQVYIQFWFAQT